MDKFDELLGLRIKQIRLYKGLSQEELAHQAGLQNSQIGYIERGEKSCTVSTLKKVADGLEITMSELMRFEDQYSEEKIDENIEREFHKYLKSFDEEEQTMALHSVKLIKHMKDKYHLKSDS